jgi:predicted dehydrogenase
MITSISPMSPSSPQTLGLIGCGIWGRNILRDLKGLGHAVWVAEPSAEGRAAASGLADGVVGRHEEFPDVNGLIVATPASTHATVVAAAFKRGVPILCEKPLTTDVAEARALVALCRGNLFTGHIWCYHPGVEMLAEIARSGELGPVHLLRSTRTNWTSPRRDVDSVWNLAPHDVALAQFILGEIPPPRFAHAELLDGRCVGMLGILGTAPSAVFEVSNRFREKRREIRLHCRDGVAVLSDADAGCIEISRNGTSSQPVVDVRAVSRESALTRELSAFCAYLAGGPAPRTTGAQGLAVVEALVALRRLAGLSTDDTHR